MFRPASSLARRGRLPLSSRDLRLRPKQECPHLQTSYSLIQVYSSRVCLEFSQGNGSLDKPRRLSFASSALRRAQEHRSDVVGDREANIYGWTPTKSTRSFLPQLNGFGKMPVGMTLAAMQFSTLARPTISPLLRPGQPGFISPRLRIGHARRLRSSDEKMKDEPNSEMVGVEEAPKDTNKAGESGKSESLDPRTFLLGTTESLRKVTERQVGDMAATYAIVLLLATILLSPVVGRYMRGSESTYDELDTDDQVVDMSRIIKRDFFDKLSADGVLEDKSVVDSVLAEVLSSKALQEQAVKFVVTIVQSPEVKAACQKLLKDLWNDLVSDPETTAQVILLLNAAIQNDDIRSAAKKLVMEIVEDEEVLEELVRVLQKLGQDQEVLDATKTLLTESTHNALNDPEILDHSMEFATDVVGDDVVQRTAGEALRNTLSYAVQPGISILLAAAGVGLFFLSVISLGYARSSPHDAKVLDEAVSGLARSLQPSPRIMDRVWNFLALQIRGAANAVNAFFTTVLLPFHCVQYAVARIEYTSSAARKGAQATVGWIAGNSRASLNSIVGTCAAVSSSFSRSFSWLQTTRIQVMSLLSNTCTTLASWATSAFEFVASVVGGAGVSSRSFVNNTSARSTEIVTSVSRQLYPRVGVAVESLLKLLTSFTNAIASFALVVTGNTGGKKGKAK